MARGILDDARRGIAAAWRLAAGRADAIVPLVDDAATLRRSFLSMLFCLPPFAILVLAERRAGLLAAPPWRTITAELLVDVVGWLVFLELTRVLADRRGLQARWSRFAALWNWSNLTGMVLTAIGALPIWLGVPQFAALGIWVAMLVWALMVEWVAIRVGLGLPGPLASALLAFDVALGFTLDALRATAAG